MATECQRGMLPPLSHHACVRMRQRGNQVDTLHCLLDYGSQRHDGRGAQLCYFDRRARRLVDARIDPDLHRRLRDRLDCYAVIANDGVVVTVGHRYRRPSRL